MEFNEKMQELRKQKGLTQEELAERLYVSRTAVSKWESGRGYPNIESLKAIANFFSVSIDVLLSGDEVLTIAEEDQKEKETHFRDLVFGLLDCSAALLLFLPFFGQQMDDAIQGVSLLRLTEITPYLRTAYFVCVIGMALLGIMILALQGCRNRVWRENKYKGSLLLNGAVLLLFIISLQPYGAVYLFVFLAIKTFLLMKRP
ncbi:MAG: helix-turn-helix transcriptional regulator [Ruminiclostridium sp.]|nr:helix-turn-helix transcriptional regulator [Ruminiclostridium sp.]MBQ9933910.1 helix-turn-helix transcriptional regulator [Ruminiclostridium sp.]